MTFVGTFFYSATTVCIEWASCSWSYWTTVFFDAHNSGSETLLLTLLSFDVRSIQLPFHDVQYMYCMRSVGSISHTSLSLKIITFTRYPFYWKRNLNTCLPTDDSQWRMRAIAVIRGWQNIPAIAVFSQPLHTVTKYFILLQWFIFDCKTSIHFVECTRSHQSPYEVLNHLTDNFSIN